MNLSRMRVGIIQARPSTLGITRINCVGRLGAMLDLLKGIRVVSFNHFLLGPMGIQALGDLGADVISIENAEGAWQRHWSGGDIWHDGQSALHLCANRNKRSVAIDLKSSKGRELALRLIDTADVVSENFRPGVMEKLGLGYEALKARRAKADLRVGIRLRPGWPLRREARPGPASPGSVRHDGHHRPGCDRAAAGRRVGHRPSWRRAVRHGHPGGDRAPAAYRTRLPRRRQPDAGGARPAGRVAGRLGQCAGEAARHPGLPPCRRLVLRCSLRRLRHAGRLHRLVPHTSDNAGRGASASRVSQHSPRRTPGAARTRSPS